MISKSFPVAGTVEFIISNVAYRATVYKTVWSTLKSGFFTHWAILVQIGKNDKDLETCSKNWIN